MVHVVRDVRDDARGGGEGGVRGGVRGGGTGNTAVAGPGREPTVALTRLCAAACLTPLCQYAHRLRSCGTSLAAPSTFHSRCQSGNVGVPVSSGGPAPTSVLTTVPLLASVEVPTRPKLHPNHNIPPTQDTNIVVPRNKITIFFSGVSQDPSQSLTEEVQHLTRAHSATTAVNYLPLELHAPRTHCPLHAHPPLRFRDPTRCST